MAAKKTTRAERPAYRCRECGWVSAKWVGRCGECQSWGTVEEPGAAHVAAALASAATAGPVRTPARPIGEVEVAEAKRASSQISELDRVLGGGVVAGAVILLTGEPGVGKSTLLLEMAARRAAAGERVLYLSGEESAGQVRMRAERMGALSEHLYLAAETDLGSAIGQIEHVDPELLIVDSVQTIASDSVDGLAGGVAQVRTVSAVLTQVAKARGMATVLVGHVTKDGALAGPRTMEHIVDVVLHFEGERHNSLRMLRAVKNRFGAVDEIGCFELTEGGIEEVPDPSGLFLSQSARPTPGTAITVTVEGRRPLVAEVQALVAQGGPQAKRTTTGLVSSRVGMVAAVLQQVARLPLAHCDLYAATVGGVKLSEPAADLAIALALATAAQGMIPPQGLVAIGELGLAGDIRRVPALQQRLREAQRLGFRAALVPAGAVDPVDGMKIIPVATITVALREMSFLRRPSSQGADTIDARLRELAVDLRLPDELLPPGRDGLHGKGGGRS